MLRFHTLSHSLTRVSFAIVLKMQSKLFTVPLFNNFVIYVLFINTNFYIRAKELCKIAGYNRPSDALKRKFPFEKYYLRKFGVKSATINGNSLMINITASAFIIQKSPRLTCFDKVNLIIHLRDQLVRLAILIQNRENVNNSGSTLQPPINITLDHQSQNSKDFPFKLDNLLDPNVKTDQESHDTGMVSDSVCDNELGFSNDETSISQDQPIKVQSEMDFEKEILNRDFSNEVILETSMDQDSTEKLGLQMDSENFILGASVSNEITVEPSANQDFSNKLVKNDQMNFEKEQNIFEILQKVELLQKKNLKLFEEILKKFN